MELGNFQFNLFFGVCNSLFLITIFFLPRKRIGGTVQSMVWDRLGRHLALIFENSPLVVIYRTDLIPHLLITPK